MDIHPHLSHSIPSHSPKNTVEKIQRFLVDRLEADLFVTGPSLDAEIWLQSLALFGRPGAPGAPGARVVGDGQHQEKWGEVMA